jgi:hypothetical protein
MISGDFSAFELCCHAGKKMNAVKGLYRFYKEKYPGEKKFYDLIPPLLDPLF